MLAHMKMHHTNGDTGTIMLTLPNEEINRVAKAIETILKFGGHTVHHFNDQGEEMLSMEEVFPDATPGMILQGFRGRDEMTQEELAKRLNTSQNMVSDIENSKRPISVKMAKALAKVFDVPYKAFL